MVTRFAAILLVSVLSSSTQPSGAGIVAHVLLQPAYQQAATALELTFPRFVGDIISLTETPAPPHQESARAALCLRLLREAGLPSATIDPEGNVVALRPGRGGALLVVAAHLDTVFPVGTDVHVRRDGTRLSAPGVGDDAAGVATIIAIARALTTARAGTMSDILFVADVGEEANGDLRGIRYLLTKGIYRNRVTQFLTIDGAGDGRVITASAVGSRRYRVTFEGPGGHSFGAFGTVNPASAMADAITAMNSIKVPEIPRTTFNVGVLGGGTSVNSIPASVWMEVDLRSESPVELARLDQAFRETIRRAAEAENRAHSVALGVIAARIEQIGFRPAGETAETSRTVAITSAAIRAMNLVPLFASASTDANLPMSMGIPSVAIDAGIRGDRPHSPDEWIDVTPSTAISGLQRSLLIVLSLAGMP